MKKTHITIFIGFLFLGINTISAINDTQIQAIREGFNQRRDNAFDLLIDKPLVIAAIEAPLGTGRPPYSRAYSYSLIEFAFKCFWLNEQNDAANNALTQNADYYIANDAAMRDVDNFYWSADELSRIVEFFGTNGTKNPGLLNPTTEAKIYQLMWLYVKSASLLSDADYKISGTWYIENSENHHIQGFSTNWHFSKLLKEKLEYKNLVYDDGHTPLEHYSAWNTYSKQWIIERAKKGLFIEMANENYGSSTLKGLYNFYDFGDKELHSLAGKIIDLNWAAWAEEQLDAVWGGSKNRVYPGFNSKSGRGNFWKLSWYYFGIAGPTTLPQNFFTFASSTYRLPDVVIDIALDKTGKGEFEIKQRKLGLAVPGYYSAINYRVRTDSSGISRYSFCTPDFIIGSAHFKARTLTDWLMISSQNRWQGVVFDGDPDAKIYPQCSDDATSRSYNQHWSIQNKGCLITQKLSNTTYAKDGRPMRIFFSSKGLSEVVETGGWVFVSSKGAYAAVKCVSQGYTWAQDVDGKWLMCQNQFTPVIIEVVSKKEYSDFNQYQNIILSQPLTYNGKILNYRSTYNDDFTFYSDLSGLPLLNGASINTETELVFDSPFIKSKFDSGIIDIQKENRQLKLDFTVSESAVKSPLISYSGPMIYKTDVSIDALSPVNKGGEVPSQQYGTVSTVVSVGGQPHGLALNLARTILYAGLKNVNMITQITLPSTVNLLAGTGSGTGSFANGTGPAAGFNTLYGVAVHPLTGDIYVADQFNNRIRKISPTGVVTTFAGTGVAGTLNGAIANATFNGPVALAFNPDGTLYVFQTSGGIIRAINAAGTSVSTLGSLVGGNGANPYHMAYYNGFLYVSENNGHKIDKVNVISGVSSVFAGSGIAGSADGIGTAASFNAPRGLAIDSTGNVFVADYNNHKIRCISSSGVVTTIAGSGNNATTDGIGVAAAFKNPASLALDGEGNLYVGDAGGSNIRKIILNGYGISPSLPTGLNFNNLNGIISGVPTQLSPETKYKVTASNKIGSCTTVITISTTNVLPPTLIYPTVSAFVINETITALTPSNTGGEVLPNTYSISPALPEGLIFDIATGTISGTPTKTSTSSVYKVSATSAGGSSVAEIRITVGYKVPVLSDLESQVFTIGKAIEPVWIINTGGAVPAQNYANVTTVASISGQPHGLAFNSTYSILYAALKNLNKINALTLPSAVSLLAGSGSTTGSFADGNGSQAGFNFPLGIAVHPQTNEIFVADQLNNRIRKISISGQVTTFAGTGIAGMDDGSISTATFTSPTDIAFGTDGTLYILESSRIRKIDTNELTVSTIKTGISGNAMCFALANGYLYITEQADNKINKFNISTGELTVVAGSGGTGSSNGLTHTATFNGPRGIAVDAFQNLYIADYKNNIIRRINPAGLVTTLAGSGVAATKNGIGYLADIWAPASVALDNFGNLFVGSAGGSNIRKISLLGYNISPELPAGLVFNSNNATINGTPTVESPATDYIISAGNIYGCETTTINIKVVLESKTASNELISKELSYKIIKEINANINSDKTLHITGEVGDNTIAQLFDIRGRLILQKNLKQNMLNIIPLTNLKQGFYILSVKDGLKKQNFKIILQ